MCPRPLSPPLVAASSPRHPLAYGHITPISVSVFTWPSLCPQTPFPYKETRRWTEATPPSVTLSYFDYICEDPIPKEGHSHGYEARTSTNVCKGRSSTHESLL